MEKARREVALGFSERRFPLGSHVCYLFGDHDERIHLLARFATSATRDGERFHCLTETRPVEGLRSALLRERAELGEPGQAVIMRADEGYLSRGYFSAEEMLATIRTFLEDSISAGYRGVRGTGEMSWALRDVPGVEDVMVFEARITQLLELYPAIGMCQYDVSRFDGATIMDVLSVHPYAILRGQIFDNPYFIPPEQFLKQHRPRRPGNAIEARE